MSDFQLDLVKILVDKALLGLIAAAFGFYLSRLLEDYRSNRAYDVFLMQQRVEACKKAAAMVSRHFRHLMAVHGMLEKMAKKHPEPLTDEEAEPGYAYIRCYDDMKQEAGELLPLLSREMVDGLMQYIEDTARVSDVIKGNFDRGWPKFEELSLAHSRFIHICGAVMAAGPFREPKIEAAAKRSSSGENHGTS